MNELSEKNRLKHSGLHSRNGAPKVAKMTSFCSLLHLKATEEPFLTLITGLCNCIMCPTCTLYTVLQPYGICSLGPLVFKKGNCITCIIIRMLISTM